MRHRELGILSLALSLTVPALGYAQCDDTWTGGAGNNFWQSPDNWSNGVPGVDNFGVACIGPFSVTLSNGAPDILGVVIDGSLTITNGSSLSTTLDSTIGSLTLEARGELGGSGNLTIPGTFTWAGGTLRGNGTTTVGPSGTLNLTGSDLLLNGRTLNNQTLATMSGAGALALANGAIFNNQENSFFVIQNDHGIHDGGGASTFNNYGTFRKSAGTGTSFINFLGTFNNSSTVEVASGELSLFTGGSHNYVFRALAAGELSFAGGVHTLLPGLIFEGDGLITVLSSTLEVTGDTSINLVGFKLSGGTITGPANLTVNGLMTWAGGTMTGSGTTTISREAGFNLVGGCYLTGRTLNNAGRAEISTAGAEGRLFLASGATWNNAAGSWFDIRNDQGISDGGGGESTFTNAGLFRKTGGTGTSSIQFNGTLNNTSLLEAQSGTLSFSSAGGVNNSGTMRAAADATLNFASGTFNLNSGSRFEGGAGSAVTIQSGATVNVAAETDVNSTLSEFILSGGTISGAANLNMFATMQWTSGTMSGPGITTIYGRLNLINSSQHRLTERTLINSNVATMTGAGSSLVMSDGATWDNRPGSLFDIQNDQGITNGGGGPSTFTNAGTFQKSAGNPSFITFNGTFANTEMVAARSGGLVLGPTGGGTNSGSLVASAGASLVIGGGAPFTLNEGSVFSGEGAVIINGTLNVAANTEVSNTLSNFNLSGGTITGPANLTVNTVLNWAGGRMSGIGTTTIPAGRMLNLTSSNTLDARTLNNSGTATMSGLLGTVLLANGATWTNQAGSLFDIQNDNGISDGGGGVPSTFTNAGTFQKSLGVGTSDIAFDGAFNNASMVVAQSGRLRLATTNGGASTGIFSGSAGATLSFDSGTYTLNAGSGIGGTGSVAIAGTTATLTVMAPNVAVNSANFLFSDGTIAGPGNLAVAANTVFDWTRGTMSGAGATTIAANGRLNLSGGFHTLTGRMLNNGGTATLSGPLSFMTLAAGASLNNLAGAMFDIQNDVGIVGGGGAPSTFTNAGTLRKSMGPGTASVGHDGPFTNTGAVSALSGTLSFTNGSYTQTNGRTLVNGGTLTSSSTLNIQGGLIGGAGTIGANVDTSGGGTVVPAINVGTGIFNITGNDTQGAPSGILIGIGGLNVGTQYDQFNTSGAITLGGTLTIVANAFRPVAGDAFTIMNFGSRTGDFAVVKGLDLGAGCSFHLTFGTSSLVLQAVSTGPVMVTIDPTEVTLPTGGAQQFSSTLTGDCNLAKTWRVQEGPKGGTVDSTGFYTAPSSPGTFHVVVSSVADPTQEAVATVNVTQGLHDAVASLSAKPRDDTPDDSAALGNGDPSFRAARTFGAGTGPVSVAVSDFDGDGVLDLAVANSGSNDVSVLLGNGDGSFQAPRNFGVAAEPRCVAVGDFDGDGVPDLAVASRSGRVSVLLGNGDGTLRAAQKILTGDGPVSVAVGDFNGDEVADLVVANSESNDVSVLLGNGDGSFQTPRHFEVGLWPVAVAVGDFDGDGTVDLVVSNSESDDVSVLLGNGDGSFQAAVSFGAGMSPESVVVGDFNGDGVLDLAVGNQGMPPEWRDGGVALLLGNGDGTFQSARNYAAGVHSWSVAVADFDADGVLDIAVTNLGSNDISVLLGNGDGSFQGARNYGAGNSPWSVAVGDLDGDGLPDLVAANNGGNNVSIVINDRAKPRR